jgi:hypothetical protein
VRAVFVDLDSAPLDPVLAADVPKPHIVAETSPNRWHCYWRVIEDMPLRNFAALQKGLIARFDGDKAVIDLSRVMRIPGFVHRKRDPCLSRLVQTNDIDAYDWAELAKLFPAPRESEPPRAGKFFGPAPAARDDADGSWRDLNDTALRNLDMWVLRLFPAARRSGVTWRVSSRSLSRNLEEDLSFHPTEGIKDFGVADMGDARQGSRTPIDVVMEWLPTDDKGAARWLCNALGLDPRRYLYEERTGEARAAQQDGRTTTAAAPEPAPIFDPWQAFMPPPFPFAVLPSSVQDFIGAQSEVMGCDPSALAMSAMTVFSNAIDHRVQLKMMRNGTWLQSPRLWTALIGGVSKKKTPIFNKVTTPLESYRATLRMKYEADLRDWELSKAEKTDDDSSELPEPDLPPRFVIWDSTVEKIGELLARNGAQRGLLIKSDELSGWLASMERYSNNAGRSDRAFWLKAYDGGPYTVDRIRRGELFIRNLSVSLLGGIQPERLTELKVRKLASNGLLQRFVPLIMAESKLVEDRECDDEAYDRLVFKLIAVEPITLLMIDDAVAAMRDIYKRLFEVGQAAAALGSGFRSFIGKLDGISGALTIILHLLNADPEPARAATMDVTPATIAQTRQLIDYILQHGLEFYTGGDSEIADQVRTIASWILTSGKTRIVASDLTTNVWSCRGLTMEQLNGCISPLIAFGGLIPANKVPPHRAWATAPGLHEQFAERAKSKAARKARIIVTIRQRVKDLMPSQDSQDLGNL